MNTTNHRRQNGPGYPGTDDNSPKHRIDTGAVRCLSDVDLLTRIAAQDEVALATLAERYALRVRRFLWTILHSEEHIDEPYHDRLLGVWRKAGIFDAARASVCSGVLGIARRFAAKQRAIAAGAAAVIADLSTLQNGETAETSRDPAVVVQGRGVGKGASEYTGDTLCNPSRRHSDDGDRRTFLCPDRDAPADSAKHGENASVQCTTSVVEVYAKPPGLNRSQAPTSMQRCVAVDQLLANGSQPKATEARINTCAQPV